MPLGPLPPEPEVLDARLAWSDSQFALGGLPVTVLASRYTCSWFGTDVLLERGAFALVNRDGPLADLVGDRLRLTYGSKEIFVYCAASAASEDVPYDIGVTRRAFLALGLLSSESLYVSVQAVAG